MEMIGVAGDDLLRASKESRMSLTTARGLDMQQLRGQGWGKKRIDSFAG